MGRDPRRGRPEKISNRTPGMARRREPHPWVRSRQRTSVDGHDGCLHHLPFPLLKTPSATIESPYVMPDQSQ